SRPMSDNDLQRVTNCVAYIGHASARRDLPPRPRSPLWRSICPLRPRTWTRLPETLFEFAGSDRPSSSCGVLRPIGIGPYNRKRLDTRRLTMPPTPHTNHRTKRRPVNGATGKRVTGNILALKQWLTLWDSWPHGGTFPDLKNGDQKAARFIEDV